MSLSNLSNLLFNWNKSDNPEQSLAANNQLIALGDTLQGILKESNIKVPRIAVIGSQSSGKSSVINNVIGLDFLPTGDQMVTRLPLHLEIIKVDSEETVADFGTYIDGVWASRERFTITFPHPTTEEKTKIQTIITQITNEIAGNNKNIGVDPINLRISSPYVTNLSMIDLPGLTKVSLTAQGQPSDIKKRIKALLAQFIKCDSTLILAVIAGRSDLEVDSGLEFVKKFDPEGKRTVGVLTKIDLMDNSRVVGDILEGKIARDLQLKHGYFAVRNRNNKEKSELSVVEGLHKEHEYFSSHPVLKDKRYSNRLGTNSLKKYLAHILSSAIKSSLPNISTRINKQLIAVSDELSQLGQSVPEADEAKVSYLNSLVVNFARDYNSSLYQRGSNLNAGKTIKDQLVNCRQDLQALSETLFDGRKISDSQLAEIIDNSEGNHMTFPYPPVEILEHCLQDQQHESIKSFNQPVQNCNGELTNLLITVIEDLLGTGEISRYPKLCQLIKSQAIEQVIIPNSVHSSQELEKIINAEQNYIWTDDPDFHTVLKDFGKKDIVIVLRELLQRYLRNVAVHMSHIAPKLMMLQLVRKTTDELYQSVYAKISSSSCVELLTEDPEVDSKRKKLVQLKNELQTALKTIAKLNC